MNYYQTPNYYINNNPYQYQSYQQPQTPAPVIQQPPQPQTPVLNGKIVDSEDVVRVTEVPMGGYGIFPKADMSEIYIKSWNNNGTTRIIKYEPAEASENAEAEGTGVLISQLMDKVSGLEEKIDSLIGASKQQPPRKEVAKNGF